MADIFNFYVYDDRSIRYELAEPIMLEDKDVTQFRFRIPKVLNNIDMSSWEWWFIFVNAKKVKYTSQLVLTDDEDDPDNFSVATYTVGYGFSGYVGQVSFSIEALNVSGEDIVNEWHTKTYTTHVLDTLQGTRAVVPEPAGQTIESLISNLDARVTALEQGSGSGISQAEKDLILTLFSKAAYAEGDASTAYDTLESMWTTTTCTITYNLTNVVSGNEATTIESGQRYVTVLGVRSGHTINSVRVTMGGVDITATAYSGGTITIPSVTGNIVITATAVLAAQSITAVYTQSGTVYDTDSLDSLKSDLVVTANYSGGTSETVPASGYTLSGTLTVGTSVITVNYGGKTTTFNVTVSGETALYPLASGSHTFTSNYKGTITVSNGNHFESTITDTKTSKARYADAGNLSANDVSMYSSANNDKHVNSTIFSLAAGDVVKIIGENVVILDANGDSVTPNYGPALNLMSNTADTSVNVSQLYGGQFSYLAKEGGYEFTVDQAYDINELVYYYGYAGQNYSSSADVKVYVNGVRYI